MNSQQSAVVRPAARNGTIVLTADVVRRVLLFVSLLLSGGSMIFPRIPLLSVAIVLCMLLSGGRLTISRRMLGILALLTMILVLSVLRPQGPQWSATTTRFANFFAALMLLGIYMHAAPNALSSDLNVLLRPMAWQAILTVLLALVAPFLFIAVEVNDATYYTVGLLFTYHRTLEDATGPVRPDGFFFEPGIFQIYLNIYLYLCLFVFKNPRRGFVALLAVLSTQSTTGVAIGGMLISVSFIRWILAGRELRSMLLKCLVALLVLGPVVVVVALNVLDKLTGDARGSFWARQFDLLTGINVIMESPLFGIGFDYEEYYRAAARLGFADTPLTDRITDDRGNTNGIIFLFYSIGVPLGMPFLIGLFRQQFFAHRWLIGGTLLFSLMSESMIFTPFFLMLIFSGLLRRRARKRT